MPIGRCWDLGPGFGIVRLPGAADTDTAGHSPLPLPLVRWCLSNLPARPCVPTGTLWGFSCDPQACLLSSVRLTPWMNSGSAAAPTPLSSPHTAGCSLWHYYPQPPLRPQGPVLPVPDDMLQDAPRMPFVDAPRWPWCGRVSISLVTSQRERPASLLVGTALSVSVTTAPHSAFSHFK